MPSPFPGMNPYLEQEAFWQDFHLEVVPAIRRRLVAQVRPKYIVMLDEHIYVQELPPEPRRLVGRADVSLAAPRRRRAEQGADVGIVEAPAQVQIPVQDVHRVPFLEVRDRLGRELITVLELLSPTNKRGGADREQYVAKREQVLKSAAHFVEIDLLRRGRPMPLENRPRCDYSVLVSRAEARPWAGFWPIRLRRACPSSRSRCSRRIRMLGSISRMSSNTSTMRPAMRTSSTPASPIFTSRPGMPPGPGRSCRRHPEHSPGGPVGPASGSRLIRDQLARSARARCSSALNAVCSGVSRPCSRTSSNRSQSSRSSAAGSSHRPGKIVLRRMPSSPGASFS